MAVLALALAIGRVIPELAETSDRWPYVAGGILFAVYGTALVAYGSWRRRAVDRALDEGHFPAIGIGQTILVGAGVLLGVLTVVLVALD